MRQVFTAYCREHLPRFFGSGRKPDAFTDVNRMYNTGEPCRR